MDSGKKLRTILTLKTIFKSGWKPTIKTKHKTFCRLSTYLFYQGNFEFINPSFQVLAHCLNFSGFILESIQIMDNKKCAHIVSMLQIFLKKFNVLSTFSDVIVHFYFIFILMFVIEVFCCCFFAINQIIKISLYSTFHTKIMQHKVLFLLYHLYFIFS